MDAETLLPRLFPQGHAVVFDGEFFTDPARCGATDVTVIGARNKAPIGVELAHRMAGAVLETVREHPGRPIVLVCNEGYASSLAAATLQQLGLRGATDLDGGFQALLRHAEDRSGP